MPRTCPFRSLPRTVLAISCLAAVTAAQETPQTGPAQQTTAEPEAAKRRLIRRLIATFDLPRFHQPAAKALARCGVAAIPELQAVLDQASTTRATGAARALMMMKPAARQRIVPILQKAFTRREALRDDDVLRGLWVHYLLGQLSGEPNPTVIEAIWPYLDEPNTRRSVTRGIASRLAARPVLAKVARELYSGVESRQSTAKRFVVSMASPRGTADGPDLDAAIDRFVAGGADRAKSFAAFDGTRHGVIAKRVLKLCRRLEVAHRDAAGDGKPAAAAIAAAEPFRAPEPDPPADPAHHAARLVGMLDLEIVRGQAIAELAGLGTAAVAVLEQALDHADPRIAVGAVTAYVDSTATPPKRPELLLRVLEDVTRPESVRLATMIWLSRCKPHHQEVLNAFERLLGAPSTRLVKRTVDLLGNLGHDGDAHAQMVLVRALRHRSAEVQIAAVFALAGTKAAKVHLERLRQAKALAAPVRQAIELALADAHLRLAGFLIADYSHNRIVQLDLDGEQVRTLEGIFGVWDVELLDNGNLLITEFSVNRVSEIDPRGRRVWTFADLKNPYDADRLPNGNTLIADTFGRRVIEVDRAGKVVWNYDKHAVHPYDADRLPNGNTLIADAHGRRVIEVNPKGDLVWEISDVPNVHDADRLPNGNTLLTIRMLNEVREVDPKGETVFRLRGLASPSDADRLPDGRTLVAENGHVRIFNAEGQETWRKGVTWAVEVNPVWQDQLDAAAARSKAAGDAGERAIK